MFEAEADFDLDEDFLKDIDEKEDEYYSQKLSPDGPSSSQAKRKRTSHSPTEFDQTLGDITFDDQPDFARTSKKPAVASPEAIDSISAEDSSNRKRALDILSSSPDWSEPENAPPKITTNFSSSSSSQKSPQSTLPDKNLEESRKKLALEILQKGSSSDDNFPLPTSRDHQQPSRVLERSDFTEKIGGANFSGAFKKPGEIPRKSHEPLVARNSRRFVSKDRAMAAPRMTLVRKFPGPAGLLPDCPDSNLENANFLNSLDVSAADENLEDSRVSEFCSQNTERLFSGGAWRCMLDDLPSADLLRGHEIATIKRSARGSREKSCVALLAGVVQRIDHSVDNPRLLLKDMTDTIEATMHSDIPLAHPNVIEPGVVLLLRDAGMLSFRGSQKCPGSQYHLMIGPRSILAVYNEKARLVSSPSMDSMKNSAECRLASQTSDFRGATSRICENTPKILSERNPMFANTEMDISDFGSDDDASFAAFDLGDLEDSQSSGKFAKTLGNKVSDNFSVGKSPGRGREGLSQICSSGVSKKSTKILGGSSTRDENFCRTKVRDGELTKNTTKVVTSFEEFDKMEESRNENSRGCDVVVKPKKIVGVRSKLLQFRSNDVLTPPKEETTNSVAVDVHETTRNAERECSDSTTETFGDDLLASDNDTEDEILSQLDVDSIMANYNEVSQNSAS